MPVPDSMSVQNLTAAVQKLPLLPTKIHSMGLFTPQPIRTVEVKIDEEDGRLALVSNSARGSTPAPAKRSNRHVRTFLATHLAQYRKVLAEDSQGVRKFGSENEPEALADVVNARMQEMKNNIGATREWQHIGAIKGKVMDADGTTELADLYDEFGVTQTTVAMSLSTNTNPRAKLMEAKRASEKLLGGLMTRGTIVLASPAFMDALTGNSVVQKVYEGWADAKEKNGGDVRAGFDFGGCRFIEYDASVGDTAFIAEGEAYLFPNVPGLFIETLSPADYIEAVNTMGLEFYAKAKVIDLDKGYEIEVQSNPLSLCTMPGACIKLLAGAGT